MTQQPAFPAARIGDPVTHDATTPAGVIGPPITPPVQGSVFIEDMPAAHVTCTVVCSGATAAGPAHPPPAGVGAAPLPIIVGSPSVFINGMPAARWAPSGDMTACGALLGDPKQLATRTVFIGGGCSPRPTAPVITGLGDVIDRLASLSPVFQKQLKEFIRKKWQFEWGKRGTGSYCVRTNPQRVVVDSALQGDPIEVLQTLAHEVGHARYSVKPDTSSKQKYVDSKLADEGAATLNNIKVQRDLKATGGPDIGVAGNATNRPAYDAAYDRYQKDGDGTAARRSIGTTYGTGEKASVPVDGQYVNYRDYYAATWKNP